MRAGVIIQTRMGSTRLPGKVMLDICGKPVIQHVIERIRQSKELDEIIIATTTLRQDDIIADEAQRNGVRCFRGSEDDVLSRYYFAAKENDLDVVVRVTSDCPLIDPLVTGDIVKFYKDNNYDIVTNACPDLTKRTYPRGLDTEVFSFRILEDAFNNARQKYQREHVTPYIYENSKNIHYYKNNTDYSEYRWTLDTKEDFELISTIYRCLYKGSHDFYYQDILNLIKAYPEIASINEAVEQKKITDAG
ncbi:MAG: cytidylyltransferase domain-containing protein [Bacillota bacterium]